MYIIDIFHSNKTINLKTLRLNYNQTLQTASYPTVMPTYINQRLLSSSVILFFIA